MAILTSAIEYFNDSVLLSMELSAVFVAIEVSPCEGISVL